MFRKKARRVGEAISFERFKDVLEEIFFVKDTEDRIVVKQKELKLLDESNLRWAMEQKEETIAELERLLTDEKRDESYDHVYLFMAHQYMETADTKKCFAKVKSVTMPFSQRILPGEKVEQYGNHSSQNLNYKRQVPSPRSGIKIVKNYDQVASKYFGKKSEIQDKEREKIKNDSLIAQNKIKENRAKYEKLSKGNVFTPKGLNRNKSRRNNTIDASARREAAPLPVSQVI